MARIELLDLPQELLDKIYTYLGWDESIDLEPQPGRLRVLSLISKRMRETVIPRLFRTVTLSLRWQNGILIEPGLFRLRKHCPELAQHIRGVHICTRRSITRTQHHALPPFVIPNDVHDWLDPASTGWRNDDHWDLKIYNEHRQCADSIALNLHNELAVGLQHHDPSNARAEVLISHMVGESGRARELRTTPTREIPGDAGIQTDPQTDVENMDEVKPRIDALAVVMLCLPSTLNRLIVDDGMFPPDALAQHEFVLHIAAMAMKLFADRLERLTAAISIRASRLGRRTVNLNREIISSEVISSLRNIKALTLAAHIHPLSSESSRSHAYVLPYVHRWLSTTCLSDLTIANVMISVAHGSPTDDYLPLISGLPSLQRLRLLDIFYLTPRFANDQSSTGIAWPEFLIAVRRGQPDVHIELRNLGYGTNPGTNLPDGALRWFKQALSPGLRVPLDREVRLMEDFESFLPLWEAEASERGVAAAEERKSGALVDMAMGTRGIQHNVRQDQGEWRDL
nr:hypothetical protein CFP56_07443 [Quercus suber]